MVTTRNALIGAGIAAAALGAFLATRRKSGPVSGRLGYNPDYTHFVITPSGKIAAGAEYRDDAEEFRRDFPNEGKGLRVISRAALRSKKFGIDPMDAKNWSDGINLSGKAPIMSDDPDAPALLAKRIANEEARQATYKAVNAAIRKHAKAGPEAQVAALTAQGISETTARELLKPDFAGRIGVPDYKLTNNGANIRRMKERLAALTKKSGLGGSDEAYELRLHVDNERALYVQKQYMRGAIAKKICQGKFDAAKAQKGFRAIADAAAKDYARQHNSGVDRARHIFPGAVRNEVAADLVTDLKSDINRCLTKGDCGDAPAELSKCMTTAKPLAGVRKAKRSR